MIVATKVAGPGGGWFRAPVRAGKTALDRHNIERAVEGSLRRLQTDYIDLYQTHWPDPDVPIEATLEALDRLVEQGKVRAIGCSNQSAYGLMKSLWMADRDGLARYETIQNNFSILSRRFEDELARGVQARAGEPAGLQPDRRRECCRASIRAAPGPAGARFTRYREGDARTQAMTKRFVNERTLATAARVAEIAGDCGMSPVTFAVAWTLSRDFVGFDASSG